MHVSHVVCILGKYAGVEHILGNYFLYSTMRVCVVIVAELIVIIVKF